MSVTPRRVAGAGDVAAAKRKQYMRSPLETVRWYHIVTMSWVSPLVKMAVDKVLENGDIWGLRRQNMPAVAAEQLRQAWKQEVEGSPRTGRTPSLFRATMRAYAMRLFLIGLLTACETAVSSSQPFWVKGLLLFLSSQTQGDDRQPLEWGLAYAAAIASVGIVNLILGSISFHLGAMNFAEFKAGMPSLIYEKLLTLSASSKTVSSSGQTLNLLSDVDMMQDMLYCLHLRWIAPIAIVVLLALMVLEIGWAALAGVACMVLLLPFQAYFAHQQGTTFLQLRKVTDERMKTVTEIFMGIRIVKFYAWEKPFTQRIQDIRTKEVQLLYRSALLRTFNLMMFFLWPLLTSFSIFMVYSLQGRELTVPVVFTILSFIGALQYPLAMFPMALSMFAAGNVSANRIGRFLLQPELHGYVQSMAAYREDQGHVSSKAAGADHRDHHQGKMIPNALDSLHRNGSPVHEQQQMIELTARQQSSNELDSECLPLLRCHAQSVSEYVVYCRHCIR